MGRAIHRGAESTAVKAGGMAPAMHPFDNKDVFFEDFFSLRAVFEAQCVIGFFRRIIKMDVFACGLMRFRFKHDYESMVALHAQQDIGIDGDIFAACDPFFVEVRKVWKDCTILTRQLTIDQSALTGIFALSTML